MSLASDHAARMSGYGETLSADGASAIGELETLLADESVTLLRGWLPGTKVNLSTERMLGLVDEVDFVHSGTGTLNICRGMMSLESDSSAAYLSAGEQVWTNDSWTILMVIDRAPNGGDACQILSQYSSFAPGHAYIYGDAGYKAFVLVRNSGAYFLEIGGGPGYSAPGVYWFTHDHTTRTIAIYDAFTGDELHSEVGDDIGGGLTFAPVSMSIGGGGNAPGLTAFGGLLKFSGVLDGTKRTTLFPTCYDVMTRFSRRTLLLGNSVTSGSDAGGYAASWAGQFRSHLARNNGWLWQPPNMGAKGLINHRPTGTTVAPGRDELLPLVPVNAETSVDGFLDKGVNLLVIDENQNTAAGVGTSGGTTLYSDFVWFLDAIADALRATQPSLRIICGTQLAWWARDLATSTTDLSYAEVVSDPLRVKFRDWSQDTRNDNSFAAVAEVYGAINLGWPTEDDGDAADPLNDLPNGNPDLFFDDIQHPGPDGHDLMFAAFRDAYDSLPSLDAPTVIYRGVLPYFARPLGV